ncbi:tRNA CCA-pyrophosphorylase [Buchnera aphidicola]|uniref:tRNA CCA-pyrophosphorylase n=1 Tax=Buchnera aphidicola TaxID=9 RepID=UPI002543A03B|nr:tRNA CCA-pyrophosphorylase [Buchnera aphidicola]WII23725.1 tRNA CCA-pyrophosphorylase [Buchnera aphidicola (Sipha maydis)]
MKVYLVGGAVRDFLLNLPIKDRDWVVVGSTPKELIKKKFKQVGKDFPVFLHPKTFEEYALARTEKKFGFGYTGFKTSYSKKITLYQDLLRRDLTINAVAQDKNGDFIDPVNGIRDLKLRLLRHISKNFQDDPLRILRVARFSAKFAHLGFIIVNKTMYLMKKMVQNRELSFLTSHRVWNETKKALVTQTPHVYFSVLKRCNALSILFPEIDYLYKINYFLFKNYNLGEQFLFSLSSFSKNNFEIDLRFSFFCQFLVYYNFFIKKNKNFVYKDIFKDILIKNMLSRLDVPIFIRNLSVHIANNYFFLHNIFSESSYNIILLFNRINVWRNPIIILKIGVLSDFCIFFSKCKNNCKKNKIGIFLKIIFFILNSVSVKFIIQQGFTGLWINQELIRLRTFVLDIYRLRIFLII